MDDVIGVEVRTLTLRAARPLLDAAVARRGIAEHSAATLAGS